MKDGRLLRIPQEDCCQALARPPGLKYQSDGGPGMVDILTLLKGSDSPAEDQKQFLKAQVLFWLMGATDGHAKNFSLFLGPGGCFKMTPVYDVLTVQPCLAARQIHKKRREAGDVCRGQTSLPHGLHSWPAFHPDHCEGRPASSPGQGSFD